MTLRGRLLLARLAWRGKWRAVEVAARRTEEARAAERTVAELTRQVARLRDELETARNAAEDRAAQLRDAEGRNQVLEAQIEMFALWEARERARLEAEAAIFAARKAFAVGGNATTSEGLE